MANMVSSLGGVFSRRNAASAARMMQRNANAIQTNFLSGGAAGLKSSMMGRAGTGALYGAAAGAGMELLGGGMNGEFDGRRVMAGAVRGGLMGAGAGAAFGAGAWGYGAAGGRKAWMTEGGLRRESIAANRAQSSALRNGRAGNMSAAQRQSRIAELTGRADPREASTAFQADRSMRAARKATAVNAQMRGRSQGLMHQADREMAMGAQLRAGNAPHNPMASFFNRTGHMPGQGPGQVSFRQLPWQGMPQRPAAPATRMGRKAKKSARRGQRGG